MGVMEQEIGLTGLLGLVHLTAKLTGAGANPSVQRHVLYRRPVEQSVRAWVMLQVPHLHHNISCISFRFHMGTDHYGRSFQIEPVRVDLTPSPNQKYLPAYRAQSQ
jgi:hypothetical protein